MISGARWLRQTTRGKYDRLTLRAGSSRQMTNSWATPRTSISKSRPCTGGRPKCQVKPPEMAPRADKLVGHKGMDVKVSVSPGRGHIRPAEAERRHALLHRPEREARFLAHHLKRLIAAPNDAPFIA